MGGLIIELGVISFNRYGSRLGTFLLSDGDLDWFLTESKAPVVLWVLKFCPIAR